MSADHAELKNLQRRLDESRVNLKNFNDQRRIIDDKIKHEQVIINNLNAGIANLKKKNDKLVVSEHALVRYFEKVMGFDLENIKKNMVPENVELVIKKLGNGTFPTGLHKLKVKDGIVVTVLKNDE